MMKEDKFVTCISCAYVMTWAEHNFLMVAVDCPKCGYKNAFGNGVFIEDFKGYPWEQVVIQKLRARPSGRCRPAM